MTFANDLNKLRGGIHPQTGEFDDELADRMYDEFADLVYEVKGRSLELPGVGAVEVVASYRHGENEMGFVLKNEEGELAISTSYYNSWDSSEWSDFVPAETFTFTEERYRPL
jgi:hypothetical protein